MSPLLMGLLGVMLVPLFVATWRSSLLGLVCQAALIAWAAYRLDPNLRALSTWIMLADLVVVRALGAPLLLYRLASSQGRGSRNDIVAPNLLTWTIAFGLVLVAFNLSATLVTVDGDQRTLLAVAAAGILLSFLVLATQSSAFGQVVGALRLENGLALFELGGESHRDGLVIQLGQVAIVAGTVALYVWLLQGFAENGRVPLASSDEPSL